MLKFGIPQRLILLSLIAGVITSSCCAGDREHTQAFFRSYCISCHGPETAEAGLRLDRMDAQRWSDPNLLDEIYTVIERGEMPPEDASKHPKPDDIKILQKRLGRQLQGLAEKQKPGMLKRLSRVEYQNTVNDVFGTEFHLLDQLPLDNIDAGFDNNADNLHMSVVDMETYFNVANRIAVSVVGDKPEPRFVVYSTKNTDIDTHSHKDDTKAFAPTLDRDSRPLVFASPATQIKINPSVKSRGVFRVDLHGFYINAEFVPGSREKERLPAVKDLSPSNIDDTAGTSHSMSYFLRKNSGVGQSIVNAVPKNAAWQEFDPAEGFTTALSSDDTIVLRCNSVSGRSHQRMFCLEKATISGPVYDSWPPETSFYTTWCNDIDASAGDDACQTILRKLGSRLFRRPVSDSEMQQIYVQAEKEFAQGRSVYSALQAGIRGMLCSPNFLYKHEGGSLRNLARKLRRRRTLARRIHRHQQLRRFAQEERQQERTFPRRHQNRTYGRPSLRGPDGTEENPAGRSRQIFQIIC